MPCGRIERDLPDQSVSLRVRPPCYPRGEMKRTFLIAHRSPAFWPLTLWLVVFVGLSAAALSDRRGWRRYLKLRDEVRSLEVKNAAVARENQRLAREARALKSNPAAMERAVREELGFIHPGEMMLQLRSARLPGSGSLLPDSPH
jgi:cell division protein FtsB